MCGAEPAGGLAVRGLACARGGRLLFSGLGFEAGPGDVLQVRGANGSGKSSLLAMLCGLLPPRSGQVLWRQRTVAPGDTEYARDLAFLGHTGGLSSALTVRENLRYALALAGAAAAESECRRLLQALRLARDGDVPVGRLSQGQRRRAALARVVLSGRRLWLLDEPHAGLDAEGSAVLEEQLALHAHRGGVAVVTTHGDLACACSQSLDLDGYADALGAAGDPRA